MPFRFNMQKVLDYREQLEEEAKVRLAKAEHDLQMSEDKLACLRKDYQEEQNACAGKLMSNSERWLHDQYIKGIRQDIEETAMQTRMFRQIAEEARKHLAQRAIDKKLLEKLKERKKQQYQHAELKQEQYFNDEIATIRYKAPVI